MSLTKANLATYIQDLKCKAAKLTADKYIKSLKYGICSLECLNKRLALTNGAIKVLTRFYTDGKECDTCTIVGNTYYISKVCTADTGSLYANIPDAYTCYYLYDGNTTGGSIVTALVTYNANGTIAGTNGSGASFGPYSYTYNASTKILTANLFGTGAEDYAITFSDDCSTATATLSKANGLKLEIYSQATSVLHADCDWKESCHTEEDIENFIKNTYTVIGRTCNCN